MGEAVTGAGEVDGAGVDVCESDVKGEVVRHEGSRGKDVSCCDFERLPWSGGVGGQDGVLRRLLPLKAVVGVGDADRVRFILLTSAVVEAV